jgi:hypothetical protein
MEGLREAAGEAERRERERERERETTQSREGCVGVRACEVRDQRDRLADKRERERERAFGFLV